MNTHELFKLVQESEAAFRKLRISSDDYRLPHEVRMVALDLEDGKFLKARRFIKKIEG